MELTNYLDLFREHVPRGFLQEVLVTVHDCYADANDQCLAPFEEPEAVNMRPFHRRALIEQSLRKIVKKFGGVTATAERVRVGNGQVGWWYHTLVRCGPVAFTQNTTSEPNELVRASHFRQQYAVTNRQLFLFPDDEATLARNLGQLPEGVRLYGILLHGQSDRAPLPGFAVIRFPNHDYDAYLPGIVDLFQEFADIVAERRKVLTVAETNVEQVAKPCSQLAARSWR